MSNRITVYKSQWSVVFNQIKTRTIDKSEELPKNCFYTEVEALEVYQALQELREVNYQKNKPHAMLLLNKAELDIKEVIKASGCELSYDIGGDTHGIYDEGFLLTVTVEGREYEKKINL